MANLITKAQPVRVGVTNPKPVYSRVVAFAFGVAAGVGNEGFEPTGMLGESLWVHRATLRVNTCTAGQLIRFAWRLVIVGKEKLSEGYIAVEAPPLIDHYWIGKPYMYSVGEHVVLTFDMERHFVGAPHRLAVWVKNDSSPALWVNTDFVITEA